MGEYPATSGGTPLPTKCPFYVVKTMQILPWDFEDNFRTFHKCTKPGLGIVCESKGVIQKGICDHD